MTSPTGSPAGEAEAAGLSAVLARVLLAEQTIETLVDTMVGVAATSIPGVEDASITLRWHRGQKLETITASSERAREADADQYVTGTGPCVEALATGLEVGTGLPDRRWPAFSAAAVAAGFASVWSIPLRTDGRLVGVLNLYYTQPGGALGRGLDTARTLAGQLAVMVANAADLAEARTQNDQLREALETRTVIGQAQGVIMARQGVDPDEAFDILRRASQRANRKLRDVAAEVVARARRDRRLADGASREPATPPG